MKGETLPTDRAVKQLQCLLDTCTVTSTSTGVLALLRRKALQCGSKPRGDAARHARLLYLTFGEVANEDQVAGLVVNPERWLRITGVGKLPFGLC